MLKILRSRNEKGTIYINNVRVFRDSYDIASQVYNELQCYIDRYGIVGVSDKLQEILEDI